MNIKNKLITAPMAGFTDSAMRRLCHSFGSDLSVTEMVSSKAMCFHDEKTGILARITEGEGPVAVQIFGHEPDIMAESAVMIAEESFAGCSFYEKPFAIDINMGCPVKKIVTNGEGSALMKDIKLASRIVESTVKAVEKYNIPVTVKIRAGWDKNSINAPDLARELAYAGASAIAVHARTREQMYAPSADISVIEKVRGAVPDNIPVIGNGDITDVESAVDMLEKTGCDALMIGRAALGDPWIFGRIKAYMNGEAFTEPTVKDRIETAVLLISDMVREKGEEVGVRESRGRASYLIKGIRGAAEARAKINTAKTLAEVKAIMLNLIDTSGETQ